MPVEVKEELVKVRVLKPIAQLVGPCLIFGCKAEFPRSVAEKFIENGDAELYLGDDIDLKTAVLAVIEAGGEISYEKDNASLINAFEKLREEGAIADAEPEVEDQEPESESDEDEDNASGKVIVDDENVVDNTEIVAELEKLTVEQLKAKAEEEGVEIPKDTRKADIIKLLVGE